MYFSMQKAFGTVYHEILLCKLYNYSVHGIVHKCFVTICQIENEFVSIIGDNASELCLIICGIPQGSIGSLVFLIYINDICNASPNYIEKLFTNKINIFVCGKCLYNSISEANSCFSNPNKAIIDIRLRPLCAIPPPTLRPIIDSSIACNQASAPIMCMPLIGPVQFAIHRGDKLVGHMFSTKITYSPLGIVMVQPF